MLSCAINHIHFIIEYLQLPSPRALKNSGVYISYSTKPRFRCFCKHVWVNKNYFKNDFQVFGIKTAIFTLSAHRAALMYHHHHWISHGCFSGKHNFIMFYIYLVQGSNLQNEVKMIENQRLFSNFWLLRHICRSISIELENC